MTKMHSHCVHACCIISAFRLVARNYVLRLVMQFFAAQAVPIQSPIDEFKVVLAMSLLSLPVAVCHDVLSDYVNIRTLARLKASSRQALALFSNKFNVTNIFVTIVKPFRRDGVLRLRSPLETPASSKSFAAHVELPMDMLSNGLAEVLVDSLFPRRWFRNPEGASINGLAVKRLARGSDDEFLNGLHIIPPEKLDFVFMTDHRLPFLLPTQVFTKRLELLHYGGWSADISVLHDFTRGWPRCISFRCGSCSCLIPRIAAHQGRGAERVDAIGDLFLTAKGGLQNICAFQDNASAPNVRTLGLSISTASRGRLYDWTVEGVVSYIKHICPNLSTLALNLEVHFAADEGETNIMQLLEAFSAHGWNVVAHEVLVFSLPSSKRQQRHRVQTFAQRLRSCGVVLKSGVRARSMKQVPNSGFMLPAIVHHHCAEPAVCEYMINAIWD